MKKFMAALTIVVLAAGSAMAAGDKPGGNEPGCKCSMGKKMAAPDMSVHKKFLSDTMSLRQELMNKQFEMQKEFVKETPDPAVMTKLKSETEILGAKVRDARIKAGLPMGPAGHKGHDHHKGHMEMHDGMCNGMMDCPMMSDPPKTPVAK